MSKGLLACALALAAGPARAEGTKVSEVITKPTLPAFERSFRKLSPAEQAEAVKILSVESRGWPVADALPPPAKFRAVLAWNASSDLSPRAQAIAPSPRGYELRFEKGECLRDEVSWTAWFTQRWHSLRRLARLPASVPNDCEKRELTVTLAVLTDPRAPRETRLLKTDTQSFAARFEGEGWATLRRRVWEGAEFLDAAEPASLAERLHLIEVVGSLRPSEWAERSRRAREILLR